MSIVKNMKDKKFIHGYQNYSLVFLELVVRDIIKREYCS